MYISHTVDTDEEDMLSNELKPLTLSIIVYITAHQD